MKEGKATNGTSSSLVFANETEASPVKCEAVLLAGNQPEKPGFWHKGKLVGLFDDYNAFFWVSVVKSILKKKGWTIANYRDKYTINEENFQEAVKIVVLPERFVGDCDIEDNSDDEAVSEESDFELDEEEEHQLDSHDESDVDLAVGTLSVSEN